MARVSSETPSGSGRLQLRRVALHRVAGLSPAQLRLLAVLAGGAAGALARAGLTEALPHAAGGWPWGTFIANLLGALVLGWLLTRLAERIAPTRHWRPLLGTGLAGALTTFSTFQLETFELVRGGHALVAIAYPVVSLTLGMACAVAGTMAARWGRHW
jgi:CrcB protein